jgi:hypothetical protein
MKAFLILIGIVLFFIFIIYNYDDTIDNGQNEHHWPLD